MPARRRAASWTELSCSLADIFLGVSPLQTQEEVELEQEVKLLEKYGGLPLKKLLAKVRPGCRAREREKHPALQKAAAPHLHPLPARCQQKSSKKHFDSADWALAQGGRQSGELPDAAVAGLLPAKIQPPQTPSVVRRISKLSTA